MLELSEWRLLGCNAAVRDFHAQILTATQMRWDAEARKLRKVKWIHQNPISNGSTLDSEVRDVWKREQFGPRATKVHVHANTHLTEPNQLGWQVGNRVITHTYV